MSFFRRFISRRQAVVIASVIAVFAIAAIVFTPVKPARADPHAMFYTAIGQRQLFFNVLAALDQADYVEPKEARDDLLELRSAAGFTAEEKDSVKSTRTELAGLLNRSITLEGDDLWTAFQKSEFAIETRRRVNSDKLLRIYCERGLGIAGCEKPNDQGNNQPNDDKLEEIENLRKKAFIVDPYERQGEPYLLGVRSILSSDSSAASADQIRRKDKQDDISNKNKLVRPEAYSGTIAKLKSNTTSDSTKARAVKSATAAVNNIYTGGGINANVFDEIDIDPKTQQVTLKKIKDEDPDRRAMRYIGTLSAMLDLPADIMKEADRGSKEIAAFQQIEEDRGAIADSSIHATTDGQTIKDFRGRVTTPAHAKVALVQEGIGAIANSEQNLKWARPEAQAERGDIPAVDVDAQQPAQNIAGIRTSVTENNNAPADPRVKGFWDWDTWLAIIRSIFEDPAYRQYEKDLKKLDPSKTNLVAVHEEEGALDFLTAISPEKSGGAGVPWNNLLNDHGQSIINSINQL